MGHLPQMASITDLKQRHLEVLAMLENGPVVLASRNQPVGDRLEDQADLITVLKGELQIERGEVETEDFDIAEFEAMVRGEPISA
jgi:hypothetical protein